MNWSNNQTIEFLNEVHIHPELWDVKSEAYRNKKVKRDGWVLIADKFEISCEDAYRKFKSLRTYAKNEEKKKRSSGGNKPVKWFAYDAISFILDQDSNTVEDGENDVEVETVICNSDIKATVQEDALESEAGSSFSSIHSKKPRLSNKNKTSHTYRKKARSNFEGTEKHNYGPFGEHIASKLSKYDPYIRAQAEMKIIQILYDCDMQMLSNQTEELVPVTVLSDSQSD